VGRGSIPPLPRGEKLGVRPGGSCVPAPNIVRGQRVGEGMAERARALRRKMTPAEQRLWAEVRNDRLDGYHFRRQQVIDGYIVDFYCHAASLIIETDGPVHDAQEEYDAERDDLLMQRGLLVLRVRNEEIIGDLPGVLVRIREICHERVAT
jgi:very-short-patch-repair endonuclease